MAELSQKTDLLDLLDVCISDVRAGRKTVGACLAENPEHRAELEQILPAAVAIVPLSVNLDPAEKLRARYEFVEALHGEVAGGWREPLLFGGLRRRLVSLAAAVVLAVGGSGAAVVAAQDAQPSDPLYGLKTAMEQQQLALTASPDARAQLGIRIAGRRLAEAERAIEAGRDADAIAASSAYVEIMQRAYQDMESVEGSDPSTGQTSDAANSSLAQAQAVADKANRAGDQAAAAALLDVRERAQRDRPVAPALTPAPAAQPTRIVSTPARPTPSAEAVHSDVEDDVSTAEDSNEPTGADLAGPAGGRSGDEGLRTTGNQGLVPTSGANARGDANQDRGEGGRDNDNNGGRGRDEDDQGGRPSSSRQPGQVAQPTLIPTPPPTAVTGGRDAGPGRGNDDQGQGRGNNDRDQGQADNNRDQGQGRGNDENDPGQSRGNDERGRSSV